MNKDTIYCLPSKQLLSLLLDLKVYDPSVACPLTHSQPHADSALGAVEVETGGVQHLLQPERSGFSELKTPIPREVTVRRGKDPQRDVEDSAPK